MGHAKSRLLAASSGLEGKGFLHDTSRARGASRRTRRCWARVRRCRWRKDVFPPRRSAPPLGRAASCAQSSPLPPLVQPDPDGRQRRQSDLGRVLVDFYASRCVSEFMEALYRMDPSTRSREQRVRPWPRPTTTVRRAASCKCPFCGCLQRYIDLVKQAVSSKEAVCGV